MARGLRRQAVTQPGFWFPPGPLFADSDEFGQKFFASLMGEDTLGLTVDDARDQVRWSLTSLYSAVVQHKSLFTALRGGRIAWLVSPTLILF